MSGFQRRGFWRSRAEIVGKLGVGIGGLLCFGLLGTWRVGRIGPEIRGVAEWDRGECERENVRGERRGRRGTFDVEARFKAPKPTCRRDMVMTRVDVGSAVIDSLI
jgi:hypothetical protein